MGIKQKLDATLATEIERKELFALLGAAIAALIGVSHIIRSIEPRTSKSNAARGYGHSPYGR